MRILPLREKDATQNVADIYRTIKSSLGLPNVPLFFQFIGNFPEYLDYISSQIVANLSDERFNAVIKTRNDFVQEIFTEDFTKGKEIGEFLQRNRNTPEFYYFKKDIQDLFTTNAKLVFIFISLREAVKGWAVAAKKLPMSFNGQRTTNNVEKAEMEEELVFGIQELGPTSPSDSDGLVRGENSRVIGRHQQGLVKREGSGLAQALLPQYFTLCRNEFAQIIKTQQFLFLRVELEKAVLRSIDTLPHKIESPINVVLQLTKMYPTFPDLLYLLSEHFPTYAMHRWLFSAYLLP